MKRLYLTLLIFSFLISWTTSIQAQTLTMSPEEKMANASRSEKNGWIIIHIQGTPEVMGYQHGYLLADEILDLRGALQMLNEKGTGRSWDFYRNESYRLFWSDTPEEYKKEMEGIAAGVNAKEAYPTTRS